jgi:hypothetical protein
MTVNKARLQLEILLCITAYSGHVEKQTNRFLYKVHLSPTECVTFACLLEVLPSKKLNVSIKEPDSVVGIATG